MRSTYAVSVLLLASCTILIGCDPAAQRTTTAPAPLAGRARLQPTEVTTNPAAPPSADFSPNIVTAAENLSAGDPYHLGAVLSLSGPGASLGLPERDTLLMLQEKVNQAGGIQGPDQALHRVELTIIDDRSDPPQAALAAQSLIKQQVLAIIGPTQSAPSLAVIPLVTEANIPMVSLAASAAIVEPAAERAWIFKTAQSDQLIVNVLASELKARGLTEVAFLRVANPFGDGGRAAFEQAARSHGLRIVYEGQYGPEDTDMSQQVQAVKGSSARVLVNWAVSPPSAIVTKNAAEQDLAIPLYHSHGVGNTTFIDLAGPAAEGARFVGSKLLVASQLLNSDPQKAVLLAYTREYTGRYNAPISTFGGHAYDAFSIITQALSRSGADRVKLRDEIERTQDFVGISGIFTMSKTDHNGLDQRGLAIIEIQGGQWRVRARGGSRG